MRGKKGDVNDYFVFLIILFFLAISFVVVAFTNDQLTRVIKDSALNDTSVANPTIVNQMDMISTKTIQRGFVAIFGFLVIGVMVSAFLIRIHPAFIFLYIIFLSISLFIAAPLANAYQKVIESSTLSTIASQQNMMNWIMQHIVVIMVGVGALSMIVTFAKVFGKGGGDQATGDIG